MFYRHMAEGKSSCSTEQLCKDLGQLSGLGDDLNILCESLQNMCGESTMVESDHTQDDLSYDLLMDIEEDCGEVREAEPGKVGVRLDARHLVFDLLVPNPCGGTGRLFEQSLDYGHAMEQDDSSLRMVLRMSNRALLLLSDHLGHTADIHVMLPPHIGPATRCVVCEGAGKRLTLHPCGHLNFCANCDVGEGCPLCGTSWRALVRVQVH